MTGKSAHSPLSSREAGILLHPTSLPGPWDNGDLGADAYRFIDFMVEAGHTVWQILPLGPTHDDRSPYQCLSVHAGNPLLISLEKLVEEGWLDAVEPGPGWDLKHAHLRRAFEGFRQHAGGWAREALSEFVAANAGWLDDYALYRVLKDIYHHRSWSEWPAGLRDREPEALAAAREEHAEAIEFIRFNQFVFFHQWGALRRYANERAITIFGDLPIFVAHDSADVWAQREYFRLDETGHPLVVAGVPPDYFSATGQRWGNPHYDWARMEADGFAWWRARMESQLKLYDLVRIDHFRGFEAYWEVPAHEETAINGRWVKAPGDALFDALRQEFDPLPVVAEDLGTITPEVHALRRKFALPGMKVLHFAFDSGPDNPYLPHAHQRNCVVYTGTHDNDTTLGWYQTLAPETRESMLEYLGWPSEEMPWALIRAAYRSIARLAVVPMQDLLALGSEHRMNRPGTTEDNWNWRFTWEMVADDLAPYLKGMVSSYGRFGKKR